VESFPESEGAFALALVGDGRAALVSVVGEMFAHAIWEKPKAVAAPAASLTRAAIRIIRWNDAETDRDGAPDCRRSMPAGRRRQQTSGEFASRKLTRPDM
jgi:hypothetical protein